MANAQISLMTFIGRTAEPSTSFLKRPEEENKGAFFEEYLSSDCGHMKMFCRWKDIDRQ
jgi:hypothetical protein